MQISRGDVCGEALYFQKTSIRSLERPCVGHFTQFSRRYYCAGGEFSASGNAIERHGGARAWVSGAEGVGAWDIPYWELSHELI
jgi:hypothetical protein